MRCYYYYYFALFCTCRYIFFGPKKVDSFEHSVPPSLSVPLACFACCINSTPRSVEVGIGGFRKANKAVVSLLCPKVILPRIISITTTGSDKLYE